MAEYGHGGDIYSQKVEMDYSANINPLGMPEGVKAAICRAVELAAPYPDSACSYSEKEGAMSSALSGFLPYAS